MQVSQTASSRPGLPSALKFYITTMLPATSYVDRTLWKLKSPELLWSGHGLDQDQMVNAYSFCAPLSNDEAALFSSESVSSKSERYGGAGIGVNGGGVRCSNFNNGSVKGVGAGDLGGTGAPYWHSYGGASLRECIKEIIWSKLFQVALPFGAVESCALLGMSSTVPIRYKTEHGESNSRRVLLVRPEFLRLAHFLPASYFRPSKLFSAQNVNDEVRTANALANLTTISVVALGAQKTMAPIETLAELFRRYAMQSASSRAKRLIHGAISPSNIALDGRQLDFGMCSSVSTHGRFIIARGNPDSWMQHRFIADSIFDICFLLTKYEVFSPSDAQLAFSHLRETFSTSYLTHLAKEMSLLSGFSEQEFERVNRSLRAELGAAIVEVSMLGEGEPMKLLSACEGYKPFMPLATGKIDLKATLISLANSDDHAGSHIALSAMLGGLPALHRLLNAYWAVRNQVQAVGDFNHALHLANCWRLNQNLESLFVFNLNSAIDNWLHEGKASEEFINRVIDANIPFLQEYTGQQIVFESTKRLALVDSNLMPGVYFRGKLASLNDVRLILAGAEL
jgi:hypothetical protein